MDSNLSSFDLDPSVRQAYETAKDTQTITPILKEELKLTILNRRYKNGKGEINLDEKRPTIKRELTDEEIGKKLRRKEQNRRAAERCRNKKRKINDQLAIDYIKEQKKSSQLATEVEHLKKERAMLQKLLDDHAFTCARAVTPSPSYDAGTTFFSNDLYTCPTPCMQTEMTDNFNRDTSTPCGDPFDEYMPLQDNAMYPNMPLSDDPKGQYPTCTSTGDLPEVHLPDDFISAFTPSSPDMVLGRQSISDYLEEDIYNYNSF